MEPEGKLPLGLIKQVCLKLDSVVQDLNEIRHDEDLDIEDRETFNTLMEVSYRMEAAVLNIIHKECDETDFINEMIPMDEIGEWPAAEVDILDENLIDKT